MFPVKHYGQNTDYCYECIMTLTLNVFVEDMTLDQAHDTSLGHGQ